MIFCDANIVTANNAIRANTSQWKALVDFVVGTDAAKMLPSFVKVIFSISLLDISVTAISAFSMSLS